MNDVCPRCGTDPLTEHPARSRADDKTPICSKCGTDEALVQAERPDHTVQPRSEWPVMRQYELPEPLR